MSRIAEVFARLKAEGRRAFVPFLAAGDPDMDATVSYAETLAGAGASLVEIGFPYSDPIADGPVIQASYTRALDRGVKVADVFAGAARIAAKVPLVAMVSYALVHRRGPEAFLGQAASSGFAALLVPDLPLEESASLAALARGAGLDLVQMITPTTPPARAERILAAASGFVYCVSVTGITGERDRLPDELAGQLAWLRSRTTLPLCVGFGISRPEHVRMLGPDADGAIVGSALMKLVEQGGDVRGRMVALARDLASACERGADAPSS